MSTSTSEDFIHTVTSRGPAQNMVISGRKRVPDATTAADTPLVVALHGGTYTSKYFDVPGYSLLDRAAAVGVPILAIDRPGYGATTPVQPDDSIILANATVLDHVVAEVWEHHGKGAAGVVLIGHSIGGAVVSAIAARCPTWPLLGIAISGCLLRVPDESRVAWEALPEAETVELPDPMKDAVMFGPPWTHREDMPGASHAADAPVPKAELLDITGGWIERVRSVAGKIKVRVHVRQGELDRLWITDQQQVSDFGSAFASAPMVDAKLIPASGHCIDFHRSGVAFQLEQLAFAYACCIKEE